jgi:hypothetical protein
LSAFGSKNPFLYWSHILFERDTTGELNGWTLIVELEKEPDTNADYIDATIYFMSPDVPRLNLFEVGAKFELLCGKSHFGRGVIREVFREGDKKSVSL